MHHRCTLSKKAFSDIRGRMGRMTSQLSLYRNLVFNQFLFHFLIKIMSLDVKISFYVVWCLSDVAYAHHRERFIHDVIFVLCYIYIMHYRVQFIIQQRTHIQQLNLYAWAESSVPYWASPKLQCRGTHLYHPLCLK